MWLGHREEVLDDLQRTDTLHEDANAQGKAVLAVETVIHGKLSELR